MKQNKVYARLNIKRRSRIIYYTSYNST